MNDFEFENNLSLKDIERKQYYLQMLIKSLEAKVTRIEPNSTEFDDTMNAIFEAQDGLNNLGIQRAKLIIGSQQKQ